MADPRVLCDKCHSCSTGNDHMCDRLGFVGLSGGTAGGGGGGLSEFVAISEEMLYALPDSVDLDFAALIEPLTVAYHAIKTIDRKLEGLDVLIVGGGPVGFALAYTLRAENVKSILVSEPTLKRREQAKAVVDKVIDPRSENVASVCRSSTGGKGVDVAFDCAGIQVALDTAFESLARGGYYVNIAVWETPVSFSRARAQDTIDIDLAPTDGSTFLAILPQRNKSYELLLLQQAGFRRHRPLDWAR